MTKNETPRKTATPVIIWMKWAISRAIGVSPVSKPRGKMTGIVETSVFRRSFTRSQVSNTTHHCSITSTNNNTNACTCTEEWSVMSKDEIWTNPPSTANVLKNAKFFVSKALSLVNSIPLDCGSDSPVRDELSTLKPCALMTRISAGTRSPNLTSTRSPTTSSSAFKFRFSPLRMAKACCKRKENDRSSLLRHHFTYRWNPKVNRKRRVKLPSIFFLFNNTICWR